MNTISAFSLSSLHGYGPAALLSAAIATTFLLTRSRPSTVEVRPLLRRRLGVASGIVRWAVIAAVGVAALILLGIDVEGLWSTLVAALSLVAIGFVAMWSILSHMLASILIVVFRPFEIGDRIELVGDEPVLGEVAELNPVYTTLRSEDGGTLQVPNNLFFQKVLKRHMQAALTCPRPPPTETHVTL